MEDTAMLFEQDDIKDTTPATPIIKWQGGKRLLAKHILPLFPPHRCYVEVFCGGAALFFMRKERSYVEVINDINGELINLYRVVAHHMDEFIRQFDWLQLNSREQFNQLKATPPSMLTDIQRAARFYYLTNNAFGGSLRHHSFGTSASEKSLDHTTIQERLSQAQTRLRGAYIENLAWLAVMQRYDRDHSFMYCDPPYFGMTGYGVEFGLHQYDEMAHFMRTCKSKVMVSINDHPAMRQAFNGFHMTEIQATYSINKTTEARPKSQELIITNYDPITFEK
jgi:DNA adenine methylase